MRPRKPSPCPPEPEPPPKIVTVVREGQYVIVRPLVRALQHDLYSALHVTHPVTRGVARAPLTLLFSLPPGGNTGLYGFAGLEPVIIDWLERHGHEVRLAGRRPVPPGPPDLRWHRELGLPVDEDLLRFVGARDRGLIRYDPARVDPAWLVGQVVRAWPRMTTVVAATHPAGAGEFAGGARRFYSKTKLLNSAWIPTETSRLVVASGARLGEGVVCVERRDFWFALNPEHLVSSPGGTAMDGFQRALRSRMFGLLPEGTELAPATRAMMEAAYGTDEYRVTAHGARPRGADVVFLPITGGPRLGDRPRNPFELKRDGVWTNPVRTRRAVRLLELLGAGDVETARIVFPQLRAVPGERLLGRACLRAENVDQAEAILRLAPSLPLACDPLPHDIRATHPNVAHASRRRSAGARVCMTIGGTAPDGPPVAVLVNADPTAAFGPAFPEVGGDPVAGRLLVVDFRDKQHPALRLRSDRRAEAYAEAGWNVASRPVLSPWERFLERRPKVDAEMMASWKRSV